LVDAGNGAGGFYAAMLEELGAWTEGSQFLEADGRFPNHIPNPEDEEAIQTVCQAVLKHTADLGVMFDADCDRAALVDQTGRAINRNRLIALTSAMLLNQEPGLTIVTDSVTSSGLSKFIGEWGGEHYRFKRGYRNVINEAKRLNAAGINCPLAIETSGHAALRENDFLDDGMYLSTLLICEAMRLKREGQTLSSLLEGLLEPLEAVELRLEIRSENFRATGIKAIEDVMDHAWEVKGWHVAPDNREGVRINFDLAHGWDNAWFLLRLSVHDPVLPLNVESDVAGGVKLVLQGLRDVLGRTSEIDLTPLLAYIKD
jgi:phosphomannomutase